MDLKTEIKQLNDLRDKLKTAEQTSFVRDAVARTTILIGKLGLCQGETAATAAAQTELDASLAKATAKPAKK